MYYMLCTGCKVITKHSYSKFIFCPFCGRYKYITHADDSGELDEYEHLFDNTAEGMLCLDYRMLSDYCVTSIMYLEKLKASELLSVLDIFNNLPNRNRISGG